MSRAREERREGDRFPRVLAVAGGGLQGLEITYLARRAGFETLLLDRKEDPPAGGLGCFYCTVAPILSAR